jgi:murein DD-endopeptidase MepM/ murein hydrolase activator NlpD
VRAVLCWIVVAVGLAVPACASAYTREDTHQLSFAWPALGTVTSPFGRDGGRWHPGLDIGTLSSLTVRAAAAGRVVGEGYMPGYDGYGNVVLVNLGDRYSALYAHLARPLVRIGEELSAGQLIGVAGCTGSCTGTHLHFELRYRNRAVDPTLLFAR